MGRVTRSSKAKKAEAPAKKAATAKKKAAKKEATASGDPAASSVADATGKKVVTIEACKQ